MRLQHTIQDRLLTPGWCWFLMLKFVHRILCDVNVHWKSQPASCKWNPACPVGPFLPTTCCAGPCRMLYCSLLQVRIVAVTSDIFDHWYRETQQKLNFHLSIVFQLLGDMDHAGKLPCYRSPMPTLLPNPVSATAQEAGVSRRPRLSHTCGFLRLHAQVYSKWV